MIQAQLERAQQLVTLQRYKDAETELRAILSQYPENTVALSLLSICYAETGRIKEALQAIQNAIGKEPDNDYLLYLQALYFLKDNKIKEAEKFIQNAIAFDPHNATYFGLLATIKLAQKDWQAALDTANKGLEAEPDNLQCLNVRSQALYKLDKKEEAYSAIQEALSQDPENDFTHTNLGWSLLEKGDHQNALVHFREALKINPNSEYAKAGIVEALKARYIFYRWFLKYAFWIGNLTGQAQWIILLGLYFGFRFLNSLADSNPALGVFLNPIIYLYMAFAISTWIIRPLSNLFLRLNVYGRYALTDDEVKSSNFVGVSLVIGVIGLIGFLFTNITIFVPMLIFGVGMMIPLSSMFNPVKKSSQKILMALAAVLGGVGVLMLWAEWSQINNPFILLFTYGILLSLICSRIWKTPSKPLLSSTDKNIKFKRVNRLSL